MKRQELKILRIQHELTQLQMAAKLGVSVTTYNLVETGRREGTNSFWLKLQEEFELDGGTVWKLKNPQTQD